MPPWPAKLKSPLQLKQLAMLRLKVKPKANSLKLPLEPTTKPLSSFGKSSERMGNPSRRVPIPLGMGPRMGVSLIFNEAAGLAGPQAGVLAALAEQFLVCALLDDLAFIQYDDAVHFL